MHPSHAWLHVAFRLANALLVATQFDPDEWWQGPEVAHRLAFGYGELTWEWTHGVRSHVHVLPFVLLYRLLGAVGCDSPALVAHAPRLLQGLIAAVGEIGLARFASLYFDDAAAGRDTLLLSATSWFSWYCGVRTYSSSMEASLLCLLLAAMAAPGRLTLGTTARQAIAVGALAALACLVRPTASLFLPALLVAAAREEGGERGARVALAARSAASAALVASLGLCVDRYYYGEWVVPPLRFAAFNILTDGASYYGTHPWHWYATAALPAVLATHAPLVAIGVAACARRRIRRLAPLAAAACAVAALSACAHKELRFLAPALPLLLAYGGVGLASASPRARRACLASLAALNGAAALYLSSAHQRAPLDAMAALRAEASAGALAHVDLLTRCHQTPAYSHLHTPVRLTMLHCPPPALRQLKPLRQRDGTHSGPGGYAGPDGPAGHARPDTTAAALGRGARCANECDCFFLDVPRAISRRYGALTRRLRDSCAVRALCRRLGVRDPPSLPSHVVIFEDDYDRPAVGTQLRRLGYSTHRSFFHDVRPPRASGVSGSGGAEQRWWSDFSLFRGWRAHSLLLLRRTERKCGSEDGRFGSR